MSQSGTKYGPSGSKEEEDEMTDDEMTLAIDEDDAEETAELTDDELGEEDFEDDADESDEEDGAGGA